MEDLGQLLAGLERFVRDYGLLAVMVMLVFESLGAPLPGETLLIAAVFARYGAATVIFARFLNILRQLNGIVAGTLGMPWRRFFLFNALGGALWVATWVMGTFIVFRL